jgi:hypothetical protein
MLEKGQCILVSTKTLEDVFGDVVYVVEEVGLRVKVGSDEKENGIKFRMLGGNGPSAREGICLVESWDVVEQNIKSGVTSVIDDSRAKALVEHYEGTLDGVNRASGIVEMD